MGVTLVIYISCNQNQNECSLIQTSPYQVFTRSSPLCQCKSFCASANFPEPWSILMECCFDWSTAFRIMELLSIFRKGMSADQTPTLLFFPNQCCTKNRKEKKKRNKTTTKKDIVLYRITLLCLLRWNNVLCRCMCSVNAAVTEGSCGSMYNSWMNRSQTDSFVHFSFVHTNHHEASSTAM